MFAQYIGFLTVLGLKLTIYGITSGGTGKKTDVLTIETQYHCSNLGLYHANSFYTWVETMYIIYIHIDVFD